MAFSLFKRLRAYNSQRVTEFYSHISGLLENDMVRELDDFIQHYCYSRLQHSLDVAYYSFCIARFLKWDARSTARAGLLHDLFLYNRHDPSYDGKKHLTQHPIIALENARSICELNPIEEDIIKKHMWLLTAKPPRYKEGFIVTFVDKYCAMRELLTSISKKNRRQVRVVYVTNA